MRRSYKIIVIVACLYIVGIIAFAVLSGRQIGSSSVSEQDVLLLNDIAYTAQENWGSLDVLDEVSSGKDFVVTDTIGGVVYDSRGGSGDSVTVQSAIKNRYPYAGIMNGERVLGYVILIDDGAAIYNNMRMTLVICLAVAGLLIILGAFVLVTYINTNLILPFKQMESFAQKVAEGNLDEPLTMDRENVFGKFSESFDIMREELKVSRERELALQRKERELVASLSHDLKTPITGIKLTTELLKAKHEMNASADDPEIEKLDNIWQKADEIDNLVSDLFSSTLDDLGEFKVNCRDEESAVITQIIKRYDDRSLVTEGERPDVLINVDVKRLSQVIGNIITNSYKYAGTKIDVNYQLVDGFLEMKIRDYGPGVPEDELSLIANKFYRGKNWRESAQDGNGLGLYIAKTLMDKMDGELIPESRDGFIITLLIPLS
ncbi:MAG: hypothetical protein J6127_01825 [Clostridiales bacterium]|nr:hypothetical protein [Clostridiales bacterium]